MKQRLISLFLLFALLLCGCAETEVVVGETTPKTAPEDGYLTVHFLDVGQADCALLESDGEFMLIDGGNRDDGQFVVSYLEQQGVEELNTVVCTHAHEDHVGGLPSVLAVYPTERLYSPTKTYASKVYDDFMYYADQQRLDVMIPAPGETFTVGGAQVLVLGPVMSYAETNDTSIILRVDYGESSFLFTGDMETAAENDMLDHWGEENAHIFQVDVLKVGHHGSNTSTGYRFLHEVDPTYGVISVGEGNSYGHPHEEPMSRLNQAGVSLFRTDELGTVIATTNGDEIAFTWNNQASAPTAVTPAEPAVFIGNKNSKKFHSEECANLPAPKNQIEFESYEAAVAEGFSPCGSCLG